MESKKITINNNDYDADKIVPFLLKVKAQNAQEEEEFLAEYYFGSDMSAWVEKIIADKKLSLNDYLRLEGAIIDPIDMLEE